MRLTRESGIGGGIVRYRPIYDINIVAIRLNGCPDRLDALPFSRNEC